MATCPVADRVTQQAIIVMRRGRLPLRPEDRRP
jgi:hypothetical protein